MKRAFAGALMALLAAIPGVAAAQALAFGPMLSDGAVLQRGQPIELAGQAAPGARVTVDLGGAARTVTAGPDGRWTAAFPASPAATGLSIRAESGGQSLTLRNIAVGDVFLCSGQSNMAFSMAETALQPGERRLPIDRGISLFLVPKAQARTEQAVFSRPVQWINGHAGSGNFSAVCFLAGRAIAQQQKVPVGLIDASLGGTPIEAWMPYEGLKLAGGMESELAILDAFRTDPVVAERRYGAELDARWQVPPPPGQDRDRPRLGYANLFNGMIAPLGKTRLAGVIWYQGENNVRRPEPRAAYRRQLTALLASWRGRFGARLPVVIVQLAPFGPLSAAPDENNWSEVREAQRLVAQEDPLAELVTTVDVGERLDIHPPLKKPVGMRSAAALSFLLYGGPAEALGPRPLAARREGPVVRVRISSPPAGLMAASWGRPGPFILCQTAPVRDCRFADARLEEGGVAVAVEDGFTPDLVRYCWGAAPICNLFDRAQRPVPAFELRIGAGN